MRRLFPDYAEVERAYYQKTKIFPIMHTVVIRRDVYEKYPWVAQSLFKAFAQAQRIAYNELHETAALKAMLPWLLPHLEETERLMGRDFLSAFLRYSHEQGLSKRLLAPTDLFARESIETFNI